MAKNKQKQNNTKGNAAPYIIVSIVAVISLIASAVLLLSIVPITLFNNIGGYFEERDNRDKTLDMAMQELENRDLIPSNWVYVGNTKEYSSIGTYEGAGKDYFFIDSDKYNSYKKYWLEGIKESDYTPKLNEELSDNGDYVFHMVSIDRYDDKEFLAAIYERALYYKYVYRISDEYGPEIEAKSKYDYHSFMKEYKLYQNDKGWTVEDYEKQSKNSSS